MNFLKDFADSSSSIAKERGGERGEREKVRFSKKKKKKQNRCLFLIRPTYHASYFFNSVCLGMCIVSVKPYRYITMNLKILLSDWFYNKFLIVATS